MADPSRRQILAGGAVFGAALFAPGIVRAQPVDALRIGVISPSRSGLSPIVVPGDDIIGDGVRQGALMADGPIGELAAAGGIRLAIMPTSAPTASVAARAAQRFADVGSVDAIIGGVGAGHAEMIAPIAEAARIPFFNVASPSLGLRRQCLRYSFHVDASAAMYIDALVLLGASRSYRRWFVVHDNTPEGEALRQRAVEGVERLGEGGTVVGAAAARPEEAFYGPQINAADSADADAILLLIGDIDQLVFISQQESLGVAIPALPLPYANTQTRQYLRELRSLAPATNPRARITLWDASLDVAAGGEFNQRYLRQWGAAANAPAWASYHAVKILVETVLSIGATAADAIVDHLEAAETEFDVAKGTAVSFRPWDHQLRQPLYAIRVDQEQEWIRDVPTTHVALAEIAGELPLSEPRATDIAARLDLIGDGPGSGCGR